MEPGSWIVCLGDDWGYQTSSAQQLMRQLSSRYRVLWVNSVGMRTPRVSLRDLRRLWMKGVATPPLRRHEGVDVASLRLLPYHHNRLARALNRPIIAATVARWKRVFAFDSPLVVCAMPSAVDIALAIPACRRVYYCMDDFATLPGVDWHMVEPLEAELLRSVDRIIVTSDVLASLDRFRNRDVAVLPHGVDFDLFSKAQSGPDQQIARSVEHLPRPLIGFAGLLDDRIDIELLGRVAELGGLLLVGEASSDVRHLAASPGVLAVGYVPHREVPRYLAACDVLVAPYRFGNVTRAIQPLKIREYLATGKPVVASALPALQSLEPVVELAVNDDAFLVAVQRLARDPRQGRRERIAYARDHSWETVAREFERLVS